MIKSFEANYYSFRSSKANISVGESRVDMLCNGIIEISAKDCGGEIYQKSKPIQITLEDYIIEIVDKRINERKIELTFGMTIPMLMF